MALLRESRVGYLKVRVCSDRLSMGAAAAEEAAATLREAVARAGRAAAVFAAAPSQEEFLAALREAPGVPWERVTAFHLDEYLGLGEDHPASFRRFLRERLFSPVRPGTVHLLRGDAPDPEAEAARYAALLREHPLDLACLGIGENGHLAFNDPPVADFRDPKAVKVVELDLACRRQQVHDGCFPSLEDVPRHALTLTVPAILAARRIVCVVPGERKRRAVEQALLGPVSTACPASILRTHPEATLYLDVQSLGTVRLP